MSHKKTSEAALKLFSNIVRDIIKKKKPLQGVSPRPSKEFGLLVFRSLEGIKKF